MRELFVFSIEQREQVLLCSKSRLVLMREIVNTMEICGPRSVELSISSYISFQASRVR